MIRHTPFLAIAVFMATVAFALSPLLTSDFAGYRPEQFPVVADFWPIQPAGWAFSIWGVIYIWLIAGAAWGGLNAPRDPEWGKMRAVADQPWPWHLLDRGVKRSADCGNGHDLCKFDSIRHIDRKWRNNLIECDHAAMKRLLGYRRSFRSLRWVKATLRAIERIRTIKRGHVHHKHPGVQGEI